MTIRSNIKVFSALAAFSVLLTTAQSLSAQDIRIFQRDGNTVVGRLKMFEDGVYEIDTPAGLQRIPVSAVVRIEPAASSQAPAPQQSAPAQPSAKIGQSTPLPTAQSLTAEPLLISGSRSLGDLIVRPLLEAYAQQAGASNPVWTQKGSSGERALQAQLGPDKIFAATMTLKGSSNGIEDLVKGNAQIAMLERRPTPAEVKRITAAGLGEPLALGNEAIVSPGAVVVLVHPANPVKTLSFAQVSGIFAGRIRNWAEVGGQNRRIQVLAPSPGSSLINVAEANLGPAFDVLPSARRLASSLETGDLVGADPAAIGLAHSGDRGNAISIALTNECGLTFDPTPFAIASETYPLSTRFALYATSIASSQTRDFLSFAQSATAQRSLQERGLPTLMPLVAIKGAIKFDRIQAGIYPDASARFLDVAATFVNSAARASLTFRFEGASDQLDARAVADLDRLLQFSASGALGSRKLALVGYSESTGNFAADVAKSKARAVAVSDALQRKGVTIERLFGFGPLMPVECQGADLNVQRNRRVEVWVE